VVEFCGTFSTVTSRELVWKVSEARIALDHYHFILKRLAERFQHPRPEFGEFIQEGHPAIDSEISPGRGQTCAKPSDHR